MLMLFKNMSVLLTTTLLVTINVTHNYDIEFDYYRDLVVIGVTMVYSVAFPHGKKYVFYIVTYPRKAMAIE